MFAAQPGDVRQRENGTVHWLTAFPVAGVGTAALRRDCRTGCRRALTPPPASRRRGAPRRTARWRAAAWCAGCGLRARRPAAVVLATSFESLGRPGRRLSRGRRLASCGHESPKMDATALLLAAHGSSSAAASRRRPRRGARRKSAQQWRMPPAAPSPTRSPRRSPSACSSAARASAASRWRTAWHADHETSVRVEYTVLERTTEFKRFGGPIQLASNACRTSARSTSRCATRSRRR